MAVTKILARNAHLDQAIQYVLNGEKTEGRVLTAHQNCDPGHEYQQMMDTKRELGKTGGRQCYHIIQSFKPGEITPELALELAKGFAAEYLPDYEVVIGTHTDRDHIHSHILFNSVNAQTGEKYHVSAREYYRQIRAISDRLCREHGLSVVLEGQPTKAVSYIEWLRQSKGQPTFRSMLEADLREAIEDANDTGHFFLLMEHKGYEIKHGSRLGFRLRGQERYMVPERRDKRFSEDGIRAAIEDDLDAIAGGIKPAVVYRPAYRPYRRHPKYKGFLALYVHYLYLLGKVEKRQYPPQMTPHLKQEVMKFERYRERFAFLREQGITTPEQLDAFQARTEETLATLTKRRTLLNVRKKKWRELYGALADEAALAPVKECFERGLPGMEEELARYQTAKELLDRCPISRERLTEEKAALYQQLAEVNREIRSARKQSALCREIRNHAPQMERDIQAAEGRLEKPKQKREHHKEDLGSR